ncbi:ER lumen protein-retaining receptor 2 isoform X1 [Hydra vulgaris]|uniref:ER lumen protein-retaining receptor 2 isoform X1 n=1 Tax=Hydra vulgaris TaxID=6087 RepID=UPI0001926892|nr:ER lumen protein-retaining receptor 2 [Hydra vulgaris]
MNVFRLVGDLSHLLAILLLLWKIWKTRSCAGVSGKSQALFALVFLTRYLDLFTTFVSVYNTFMKIVFLVATFATCYLILFKFKATYDSNHDSFRAEFLVVPLAGLAVLVNHELTVFEVLWTFSIYLESVAILPQLFMISKTGEAESITSHYLFALGSYRALYLLNWIYRYYFEGFFDLIAIVSGCVQTVLYCDFFYLYITKVLKGKSLKLPA